MTRLARTLKTIASAFLVAAAGVAGLYQISGAAVFALRPPHEADLVWWIGGILSLLGAAFAVSAMRNRNPRTIVVGTIFAILGFGALLIGWVQLAV